MSEHEFQPLLTESRFKQEHVDQYQDGEQIFAEGDTGRDLYVIQEGAVSIRKKTAVGEISVAEFRRGDFFGDIALLQGIPRFASAYAKGPTRLLVLQPGGFLLKIRRDPTFAFEMLQQLSHRVKSSTEALMKVIATSKLPQEEIQAILDGLEKPVR